MLAGTHAEYQDWLHRNKPSDQHARFRFVSDYKVNGHRLKVNDVVILPGFWNRNDWMALLEEVDLRVVDGSLFQTYVRQNDSRDINYGIGEIDY